MNTMQQPITLDDYINKKNSLKSLTDDEANMVIPALAKLLVANGFIYENTSIADIRKEYQSLCGKKCSSDTTIKSTNTVGMKVIRKFMQHFHDVQNYKGISVRSLWTEAHIIKALSFNRRYHSTPYVSEIIRSLSFTNGLGKITIYRPLMAKTIVEHFNAKSVLDVCVGWGGRMIGSSCVGDVSYTGIEPCLQTFQGLENIKNTLELKHVTLINKPAEIALHQDIPETMHFDIGLTSPPYYNLEIYSSESTQSLEYGSYENWKAMFLEPIVTGVMKRVKYSCWSVKNIKTDRKYNIYDDIAGIHKTNGWKQLDTTFTMTNSRRPGIGTKEKKADEVTYVFVKNDDNALNDMFQRLTV
jgi:16S rRNA G966 N2-methylase RsmD